MQIKTYTDLWRMEKKLYSIYDLQLPAPVSIRAVGIFIAVAVPWMGLLYFLHVPFSPPWFLAYFILPVPVAFAGSKPIIEGKTLFQYLSSRFQFIFQSTKYNNLKSVQDDSDKIYTTELVVWQKETK
jgi:hypothetical protein